MWWVSGFVGDFFHDHSEPDESDWFVPFFRCLDGSWGMSRFGFALVSFPSAEIDLMRVVVQSGNDLGC